MRVTDNYVFFFGSEFSNFYTPCLIELDGQTFTSSEQAFMYYKAKHFGDEESAKKILLTNIPAKAKKLGRVVKNFDSEEWMKVCKDVMKKVCKAKFEQNIGLKNKMLEYENQKFVEASPYDKIWGVGISEDDDMILDEKNWKGTNFLGEVLTEIRDELIKQIS